MHIPLIIQDFNNLGVIPEAISQGKGGQTLSS
jgi:hypothetical protein